MTKFVNVSILVFDFLNLSYPGMIYIFMKDVIQTPWNTWQNELTDGTQLSSTSRAEMLVSVVWSLVELHQVYTHVCSAVSGSLKPHGLYPARFLCPWDSLSKNTGVCCYPQPRDRTQGSHLLFLLPWQADSLPLSYLGSSLHSVSQQTNKQTDCFSYQKNKKGSI